MLQIAPGWTLEVERGPDWLFVRPTCSSEVGWDHPPLADEVFLLMRQHMTSRLVLECDEIPSMDSELMGQLLHLEQQLNLRGGLVRLCGLSPENESVLRTSRLSMKFPNFADRRAAVRGYYPPPQPR